MSGITPTDEQRDALELFATGQSLAIKAGAGTGKTATLKLLAESTSRLGQYVAFNRAIVQEAQAKMPDNVKARTAHSLAFAPVGKKYKQRIDQGRRMKSTEIAAILGCDPIKLGEKYVASTFLAGLAIATVNRFCQTADQQIEASHVPYVEGIDPPRPDGTRTYANNREVAKYVVDYARLAWADLQKVTGGRLQFGHQHYLKMWQLSGPRIYADFILFDEAQDASPVMVDIVRQQQDAQLIWVGDSNQQIYGFTGAINALDNVPAEQQSMLTQSFRFGPAVADEANRVLEMIETDMRLTGTESIPSRVIEVDKPRAILARTNAEAVRALMSAQTAGGRPHLVGEGKDVLAFARAARDLQAGQRVDYAELACFESWAEVRDYVAQDEQGGELRLLTKLVDDFGTATIMSALERMPRMEDASLVVSTAHKSKGLEFESVQIAGDFDQFLSFGKEDKEPSAEELRLLYVAVTRAKLELDRSRVRTLDPPTVETTTEPETVLTNLAGEPLPYEHGETATEAAVAATTATDSPAEPETEPVGVDPFADYTRPQVTPYAENLTRILNRDRQNGDLIRPAAVQAAIDEATRTPSRAGS